jgi:Fic family protein
MKTYERTHSWISFQLDLRRATPELWIQLGEASSKFEHLAGAPLQPAVAQTLHEIFLAKGVGATTAIEGNTLTESQVLEHVQGKLKLPPSQAYLAQEVDNILRECNRIVAELVGPGENPKVTPEMVQHFNREVLRDLQVSDGVIPGVYRTHSVVVGSVYRGAPAEDCPYLMERLCQWLNEDFAGLGTDGKMPLAILKAVLAHLYIAWIHPFGDGNGRTARLLEFYLLMDAGVPVPAAHLLSDHYNKTRSEYYRQLDHASKSGGDVLPFIAYACQGLLDGLRSQIRMVREQQQKVAWENYVHEVFRAMKNSSSHKRQRDLVLALGDQAAWVEVSKIHTLSVPMALAYPPEKPRLLARDLNFIASKGLIERTHGKARARRELIQAFLPRRSQRTEETPG